MSLNEENPLATEKVSDSEDKLFTETTPIQVNDEEVNVVKESNDLPSTSIPGDKEETSESTSNINEWVDILGSGHIKKKVVVPGHDSHRPKRGDNVKVDLIGRLEDTGVVVEEKNDFKLTVGDFEVVQGIDYALPLMEIGETCEVRTTSRFGYGDLGDPDISVPPKATLLYTLSLKEISDEEFLQDIDAERRLTIALVKKDRGNWWFQRKEYQIAIQCYRKAITYLDPDSTNDETNEKICDARLKTYNNLTIAQLNIEAYDAALVSVNHVLGREPKNIKAIFRKVKILRAQGELDEALKVCKEGLAIKPDSAALQDALSAIMVSRKKSLASQKVLYKKMFQSTDKNGDSNETNGTNMTYVWKWFGLITVAVGVISAVAIKYRS